MATDYDYQLKLLLTGDAAVGKTSLMLRFVDDTFSDKPASPAGYDFADICESVRKMYKLKEREWHCLWDTNGQERFRTVTASYYRNAQGVLLCYDVTNLESFLSLKEWLQQVDRYAGAESVKLVLVGCKDDLGSPQVSEEMEQEFAKAHSMSAFRCSSKVGTNVKEVFNALGESVLSGLMDFEKDKGHKKTKDPVFSLDGEEGGKSKSKGKGKGKGKTKKTSKGGCLV